MAAFDGIPASPFPMESYLAGPHAWLLLGFAVFTLGVLLWALFLASRERLTQETVRCPLRRAPARVFVRRAWSGRFVGIQTCSLLSPTFPVTCARTCRGQIPVAT